MKTFLASTLILLGASAGLMGSAPAFARPGSTPLPSPGTPRPTPIPRPSQQIVGQNSGNLPTNVTTQAFRPAVVTNTTDLTPTTNP